MLIVSPPPQLLSPVTAVISAGSPGQPNCFTLSKTSSHTLSLHLSTVRSTTPQTTSFHFILQPLCTTNKHSCSLGVHSSHDAGVRLLKKIFDNRQHQVSGGPDTSVKLTELTLPGTVTPPESQHLISLTKITQLSVFEFTFSDSITEMTQGTDVTF